MESHILLIIESNNYIWFYTTNQSRTQITDDLFKKQVTEKKLLKVKWSDISFAFNNYCAVFLLFVFLLDIK